MPCMSTASRNVAAFGGLLLLGALTFAISARTGDLELRMGPPEVPMGHPLLNLFGRAPADPIPTGSALKLTASGKPINGPRLVVKEPDLEGPSGQLTVTVRDPWGRLYDRDNRVTIWRQGDESHVTSSDPFHRSPWFYAALPPGSYRAVATSDEIVPFCGSGWYPSLAPYGRAVAEFTINEGQRSSVELRLFRGGRFRLALPIQQLPKEPLAAEALALGQHASNAFGAALQGPGAGQVNLTSTANGVTFPVTFYAPALNFTYRYDKILPGTDCLSHSIFPPGEYRLIANIPGYEVVESVLHICADETEPVTLRLQRR